MNGTSGWYSPPQAGASSNKSSSPSSSFQLDDGGILNDLGNFEEIGLDENHHDRPRIPMKPPQRAASGLKSLRDLTLKRPPYPSLLPHTSAVLSAPDHLSLPNGFRKGPTSTPLGSRGPRNTSPSPQSSPSISAVSSPSSASSSRRSYTAHIPQRLRRGSSAKRKTIEELEKECDSDGDDEVPIDAIFWNIPVSPSVNTPTRTSSDSENANGNSTPKAGPSKLTPRNGILATGGGAGLRGMPMKFRYYNGAIVDELSPEVRELNEKLEEWAEEEMLQEERRRQNSGNKTSQKARSDRSSTLPTKNVKLPPVQRTNGMIDPLPISKEKEAVLSRTRPSWLPPKSKEEEKRHLKEYQKMMQKALQAGKPTLMFVTGVY